MVDTDWQTNSLDARQRTQLGSQMSTHGEDGGRVADGSPQVLEAFQVAIRPRVEVAPVERQDEREPSAPRESPRREPDERVVAVDEPGARPVITSAPRCVGDETVGQRPARLAGDVGVSRSHDLDGAVPLDPWSQRVSAPPGTQVGERPWGGRHRGHHGDADASSHERPDLGTKEDPTDRAPGPRVRGGEPDDVGHASRSGPDPGAVPRRRPASRRPPAGVGGCSGAGAASASTRPRRRLACFAR